MAEQVAASHVESWPQQHIRGHLIPGSRYTSKEFFEQEWEHMWTKVWLLLGREAAAAMGISVRNTVLLLLIVTSLMVSTIVSLSGLVGFVGLVIPHIFRMIFGPDHRLLVPACVLGGASYLILCDLLARVLPSSGEMPVGIITALIGAPLFILLLLKHRT